MRNERPSTKIIIIIIAIFIAILLLTFGGLSLYNKHQNEIMKNPPEPPSNLITKNKTATTISLTWKDNSNNELGFRIFRNNVLLTELEKNTSKYEDIGLRPATSYTYKVVAYNLVATSETPEQIFKTLNPPINVWLDKIGVHENGEEGEPLREYTLLGQPAKGEEYISIIVKDDKDSIEKELHYSLHRDEIATVNLLIFNSKEVGEHIRIFATAYENDGGFAEQLAYKAMGEVATADFNVPMSVLFKLAGVDFSKIFADLFADLFAAGDDYMGSYGCDWDSTNNWGVGKYVDIPSIRENGNVGLRLWFRIECPVYDYSANK